MKKLLLSLGTVAAVVAPVAAVVACGSTTPTKTHAAKPSIPGVFTLTSTKTKTELAKIKRTDFAKMNSKQISELFAVKDFGITVPGNICTWDSATLTLSSTQTKANKIIKMSFVITPKTEDPKAEAPKTEDPKAEAPKKQELTLEEKVQKLNEVISPKGYTVALDADKLKESIDKLFGGGDELSIVKDFKGKLNDEGHGEDDYAIAIKNGDRTKLEVASSSADKNLLSSGDYSSRWGFTDESLKDANIIIFIQHTSALTTLEVYKVGETKDGKLFASGGTANTVATYIDKTTA